MPVELADLEMLEAYGLRPWELDNTGYCTIGHYADLLACFEGIELARRAEEAERAMAVDLGRQQGPAVLPPPAPGVLG
jgi:hypothetical protein